MKVIFESLLCGFISLMICLEAKLLLDKFLAVKVINNLGKFNGQQ